MRLSLRFDASLSNLKGRHVLYHVRSEVDSVQALAAKLCDDLEKHNPLLVPVDRGQDGTLVFSVNGYVVFPNSPIGILRDGDVVTVSWRRLGWETLAATCHSCMKNALSETSMSSKSSSDADEEKEDLTKEVQSNGSKKSNSTSSSSEESSDASDSDPSFEDSSDSTESVKSSSEDSSDASELVESSSEDSSSDDSKSPAKQPAETNNTSQKETSDGQNVVNGKMKELPDAPLHSWHASKTFCNGDVVMYKIVELSATWRPQESEWRYGMVKNDITESGQKDGDRGQLLLLIPWPDPEIHPDPKYALKQKQDEHKKDKIDAIADIRKLEIPLSDYVDSGYLLKPLDDFIDIRKVDSATVQQFQIQKSKTVSKRKALPKSSSKKRPRTSDQNSGSLVTKKGVAGFVEYLKKASS